ncbi:MAG: hypothetical protein JWO69_1236 [Thermoleophilia bacterium]|nr:hypothetical protein [Thermoleophilia bacterium]
MSVSTLKPLPPAANLGSLVGRQLASSEVTISYDQTWTRTMDDFDGNIEVYHDTNEVSQSLGVNPFVVSSVDPLSDVSLDGALEAAAVAAAKLRNPYDAGGYNGINTVAAPAVGVLQAADGAYALANFEPFPNGGMPASVLVNDDPRVSEHVARNSEALQALVTTRGWHDLRDAHVEH